MIKKGIILAGGKGTRIRPVIGDTPKILAYVAGKPFLEWFLSWIKNWNLDLDFEILISTCIGHSNIKDYCESRKHNIQCIKEEKPLGTFGAIANVAAKIYSKNYLILNGDTIFKADFNNIYEYYKKENKDRPLLILKVSSKVDENSGSFILSIKSAMLSAITSFPWPPTDILLSSLVGFKAVFDDACFTIALTSPCSSSNSSTNWSNALSSIASKSPVSSDMLNKYARVYVCMYMYV